VIKKLLFVPLPVVAMSLLSGCETAKDTLGLNRKHPDAFQVLDRAPLSTPPEVGLAPPKPGAKNLNDVEADKSAQQLLYKTQGTKGNDRVSKSEQVLLNQVRADEADQSIRTTIKDEEGTISEQQIGERLAFWKKNKQDSSVIDPKEEYRSIHGHPHEVEKLSETSE